MSLFRFSRNPVLTTFLCFAALIARAETEPVPAGEAAVQEIMEQLPAEMEPHLVDPLSIAKAPPFLNGEHLKFKLGWSIFTVAKAVLQVSSGTYRDAPAFEISLKTRTNSFADAFYKVRNHSTSWIAQDVSRSYEYHAIQQEGDRDRDTQTLFDTAGLSARYINNRSGDQQGPVRILPGTFDPLGIVFFVRSIDLKVGDDIVIPTSNGKEFFYTIVHVVAKVEKKFAIGKREAYVLEPDIKDIGGVFKRSPDGSIRIYISTDAARLPLRMESEVAVGKFWADLVEISAPGTAEDPDLVAVTEIE